jgi:hypothetical protein
MQIRYHNVVTGEIRDVKVGSAEETTVKVDVYTVNGESRPQWVLDSEYDKVQSENAAKGAAHDVQFGNSSRRLTPGEIKMGITSYEQKVRENDPDGDEEEELEEPVSVNAPINAPPKPKTHRTTRASSKRRAA